MKGISSRKKQKEQGMTTTTQERKSSKIDHEAELELKLGRPENG